MKTLILLRHAEAESPKGGEDHARPLTPKGIKMAGWIGHQLATRKIWPELVLCSDALRTRETCDGVMRAGALPQIIYTRHIYNAGEETLQDLVQEVEADFNCVLLIGHNPGMHNLAVALTEKGPKKTTPEFFQNFPAGSCVILQYNTPEWGGVMRDRGTLLDSFHPD
jgi:phosphohistidine phosphatase